MLSCFYHDFVTPTLGAQILSEDERDEKGVLCPLLHPAQSSVHARQYGWAGHFFYL